MNREDIKEMVREAVRQAMSNHSVMPAIDSAESSPPEYFAPWTGVSYEAHSSQQKFNINEAASQTGNLLEFASGQNCTIEKGKPCDQCGMCRSLGF